MTHTVLYHQSVLDGMALYVGGFLRRMEAVLLVTPIATSETWVNAFISHFPSEQVLSATDLEGAVGTTVKGNIFRRRLALVAASRMRFSTVPAPKASLAPIVLRHWEIGSKALYQKCPNFFSFKFVGVARDSLGNCPTSCTLRLHIPPSYLV